MVDLYPPNVQPAFPSSQTVNQVWVGLLYRITGSPKVLAKGLQPLPLVTRVKVMPPSVETRYARKVAAGCASGVIESDTNLVGVIRVSRSVCLRLNNVGRGFRPRDQVNIRGAKCERDWQQFLGKLGEGVAR